MKSNTLHARVICLVFMLILLGVSDTLSLAGTTGGPDLLPWPRKSEFSGKTVQVQAVKIEPGPFTNSPALEDLGRLWTNSSGPVMVNPLSQDGLAGTPRPTRIQERTRITLEWASADRKAVWQPAPEQGYELDVKAEGAGSVIRIRALGPAGAFYAVQTLRQLVSEVDGTQGVMECHIEDWPAIRYRGFKLCSAKVVDFYGRYKLNWGWSYHGGLPAVQVPEKPVVPVKVAPKAPTSLDLFSEAPVADLLDAPPEKVVVATTVPAKPAEVNDDLIAPVASIPITNLLATYRRIHGEVALSVNPGGVLNCSTGMLAAVRMRMQDWQHQGLEHFVVSFDDMTSQMRPATKALYGTYGKAQAALIRTIAEAACEKNTNAVVYLCHQGYYGVPATNAAHILELDDAGLPKQLKMVWTGTGVQTLRVTEELTQRFVQAWGRPLGIFYHNWPIGCTRPEIGPMPPHEPGAARLMDAFMMCSSHERTSYLAFLSGLDWAWNPEGYDQDRSARVAARIWAREFGTPEAGEALVKLMQWQGRHSATEIIGRDSTRTPVELEESARNETELFESVLPILKRDLKDPPGYFEGGSIAEALDVWWNKVRKPMLSRLFKIQGAHREGKAVSAAQPPVLDGVLNEPMWAEAPVLDGFVKQNSQERVDASGQTRVRFLYDKEWIYVGLECAETNVAKVVAYAGDGWKKKNGDHVLLQFDQDAAFTRGALITVNKYGVGLFDFGFKWAKGTEAKVTTNEVGWTAELRIPLAELAKTAPAAVPVPGVKWSFNAHRMQSYIGWQKGTWSSWSPAAGAFDNQYNGWLNFE